MFLHDQTFGDPLDCTKLPRHIQLDFCNVAGFPIDAHNNSKAHNLHAFQTQFDVDLFGGCESNLSWKCMPPAGCLYKWFCSHNPLHAISGYNTHDDFGQ